MPETRNAMAQALKELDSLWTDTVDPKYHVLIVLHGRDGGLRDAVGGEETPRFSSGGQAEKPGIKPRLRVVERSAEIAHGAGAFAGTFESSVAERCELFQPGFGVFIEVSSDEP